MKKSSNALTLAASILTFTGLALAGQGELEAARGAGFATVLSEKCTGTAPPLDYVQRLRAGMTRAGMPDEDFRQGFASGAMKAEMQYQGKPPVKECKDARALKMQIDKAFL